jgi:hypothetical protein
VEIAPIPPAFPVPEAFKLPPHPLDLPEVTLPTWVNPPNRINNITDLIPPNVPKQTKPKNKKEKTGNKRKEKVNNTEEEKDEQEVTNDLDFEGFTPPIATPKIQIPFPLPQQNQQQQLEDPPEFENSVIIPGIDYEMPLPSTEVMVTAATTASIAAVVSVTGTLAAKTVFDYLLKLIKPTLKIAVNKLAKARGKPTTTWARQRRQERQHK